MTPIPSKQKEENEKKNQTCERKQRFLQSTQPRIVDAAPYNERFTKTLFLNDVPVKSLRLYQAI